MAVRIRLRRIGKKKQPQYRLVVADSAAPRDGRAIEVIGHYDPRVDPPAVSVDQDRALWWLRRGARPSDTARSMLVRTGVWEAFTGEAAPARAAASAPLVEPAEQECEPAVEEPEAPAAADAEERPAGEAPEAAPRDLPEAEGEEPGTQDN